MNDIERSFQKNCPNGFPSLATFVASDRDGTSSIYKRFDRLAARNLLHLQSELAELQRKQDRFDEEDGQSGDLVKLQSLRNRQAFDARADTDPKRKLLADETSMKMERYRKALLYESSLAGLPKPHAQTLKVFRTRFFNGTPGSEGAYPTLGGASRTLYDDADDLIALQASGQHDRLFLLVQDYLGFLFTEDKPFQVNGQVGYISGHAIAIFVAWLSTVLAAFLLIGAIVILYKVQDPDWRLGLIAAFTCIFAGSIGLMTNARRAELFGATAA